MTREEVCLAGYDIVRSSGYAKTKLFDALESACDGNYKKAQDLINKASDIICHAQSLATLFEEAVVSEEPAYNFIVEHGHDHLMTTIIFRDMVADLTEPGQYKPGELRTMFKNYH